jgi:uncharacterized protein YegP (UPF0339 family)
MVRWALAFVLVAVMSLALGLQSETAAQGKAKGQLTFEIYKDKAGEYRWRLKAANGAVIGTAGQGYKAKADCKHGIEVIMKGAAKAKVEDESAAK